MSPRLHKAGRYHLAHHPLTYVVQRPWVQDRGMKPEGFWYGVGDGWLRFLQQGGAPIRKLYARHVHALRLDLTRVARLTTVAEVRAFHEKYRDQHAHDAYSKIVLDWRKVERDFAGIEIAPYQYALRFDHKVFWYYPWDVASGCLWDVDVIKRVEYRGKLVGS